MFNLICAFIVMAIGCIGFMFEDYAKIRTYSNNKWFYIKPQIPADISKLL